MQATNRYSNTELATDAKQERWEKAAHTLELDLLVALQTGIETVTKRDLEALFVIQGNPEKCFPVLTELLFSPPFYPHDINVTEGQLIVAYPKIFEYLNLKLYPKPTMKIKDEAVKAYIKNDNSRRNLMMGVGGILTVATLLIPIIGPIASPFVGAAAVTSTLAGLGGGFGMVGGMAVLGLSGIAGGGLIISGALQADALRTLGIDGLRAELTKLEVTQRLQWKNSDDGGDLAYTVVKHLKALRKENDLFINKESQISDDGSKFIRELKEMSQIYYLAIERFGKWSV